MRPILILAQDEPARMKKVRPAGYAGEPTRGTSWRSQHPPTATVASAAHRGPKPASHGPGASAKTTGHERTGFPFRLSAGNLKGATFTDANHVVSLRRYRQLGHLMYRSPGLAAVSESAKLPPQ
jgi:hypothetical protein